MGSEGLVTCALLLMKLSLNLLQGRLGWFAVAVAVALAVFAVVAFECASELAARSSDGVSPRHRAGHCPHAPSRTLRR